MTSAAHVSIYSVCPYKQTKGHSTNRFVLQFVAACSHFVVAAAVVAVAANYLILLLLFCLFFLLRRLLEGGRDRQTEKGTMPSEGGRSQYCYRPK